MSPRFIPGVGEGACFGFIECPISTQDRCGYSIWPASRKKGKGNDAKTRLNQPPSARSTSVTNCLDKKSYFEYFTTSSVAPNPILNRLNPSFPNEVRPKCNEVIPSSTQCRMPAHIIKLLGRSC